MHPLADLDCEKEPTRGEQIVARATHKIVDSVADIPAVLVDSSIVL